MNERCTSVEIVLSTLIDGEADPLELIPTVDHLVRCDACRAFYGQARKIDDLALAHVAEFPAHDVSEAAWRRIRAASPTRDAARRRWQRRVAWSALAASLLVVALGLAVILRPGAGSNAGDDGAYIEVALGQADGRMDDSRFVELAAELLQADRRYQSTMLEVLERIVVDASGEGSVDRRSGGDEASLALDRRGDSGHEAPQSSPRRL